MNYVVFWAWSGMWQLGADVAEVSLIREKPRIRDVVGVLG